jgi:hypothetical protein
MNNAEVSAILADLFTELVAGTRDARGPFILNSGDVGLLRSIGGLTAADASRSVNGGAMIAAHAQHLRDGLSLLNRWAAGARDAARADGR